MSTTNPRLDALYSAWMDAENAEQAALLLHQAHDSIESLALYEQKVEACEDAKAAYREAVNELKGGTGSTPPAMAASS
jgi:hypothetical protein